MFTAEDVKARLRDQPFQPVRFVTSTGQMYDIYHPDLVFVGRSFLIIGRPSTENPTVADQVTRVAMLHLTEMQNLPAPMPYSSSPPSSGNGS